MINLTAAGLTETEATCYQALLEKSEWKPAELAEFVHETRTNCYKILDKLVALNLATRFDKDKKLHYRAASPTRLVELAHENRAAREQAEKELELHAQSLMNAYFKSQEQPGVRYFQGKDGIGTIFKEIAKSKTEVVFMNTKSGLHFYNHKIIHDFRMLAPLAGVSRRALSEDMAEAPKDYKTTDPLVLLQRTWYAQGDYTAPVEWGVYDDKLYVISYGQEAIGIVIESPQITTAFRQVFNMLDRGQRALPDYQDMPLKAQTLTKEYREKDFRRNKFA